MFNSCGGGNHLSDKLFSCNHAEISIIFSIPSHFPALLSIARKLKFLKVVVCIEDPLSVGLPKLQPNPIDMSRTWASQLGLEFFTLSECKENSLLILPFRNNFVLVSVETLGSQHLTDPIPADPEQIYSICYTSASLSLHVILRECNYSVGNHR